MKTEDLLKRPISSNPSKTRPSTSKPSIIKTEETQIETITNKNKITNQNYSEEKINESEEENISKSYIINKSKSSIEKQDFLDSLAKGSRRDSFINLLDEEAQRIEKIKEQKQKLNTITLKETDIDGLYEWKTLFNNSRPLSHYTRINYKKPVLTEEISKDGIKSPKVLVDLPDDKMLYFFGNNAFLDDNDTKKSKKNKYKNGSTFRRKVNNNYNVSNTLSNKEKTQTLKTNRSNNKNKTSSKLKTSTSIKSNGKNNKNDDNNGHKYIKPMSIYAKFNPEDTFYFSNTFSDYYKEDLKSFTNKMPILKAKIKTNSKNLKRIINQQRMKSSIKEKQYYDMIKNDSLIVKKQDLIISAERRNPVPLLKSIYKQENPGAEEIKEHIRKYFNTMKPFGNDDGKTDYTKNDRWRLNRELIKFRKGKYNNEEKKYNPNGGKKRKLILSYYNINDPYIQIFNNINNDENKLNYSFEFKNNNIYNIDNFKLDENNKTIDNTKNIKKERTRSGFKQSKEINILQNEKLKKSLSSNRPHSSNTRRNNNILTENKIFDLEDYNELYKDYVPSNRFPIKTSSKVKNISYNKINEMIKERKLKKYAKDYFMTQSENMNNYITFETNSSKNSDINKKIKKKTRNRPRTAGSVRSNTKINNFYDNDKSGNNKNNPKCNYLYFNKYINTTHDLNINNNKQIQGFFAPMNCFNKLAGKYYSSSNNVHVKNKRSKRKEILSTFYENYNAKYMKDKLFF